MNKFQNPTLRQLHKSISVFMLTIMPVILRAANITVTSTADSGAGTLRAALASAVDGDTIQFALPLPAKILLTTSTLSINKSLQILGPGASELAVDGNAINTVFQIAASHTVTLAGLTVTNGHANFGGGIDNHDGDLTVSNCIVAGNFAGNSGGAIDNFEQAGNAILKIINSTLSGNWATNSGGAIFNVGIGTGDAVVQIINCCISGNLAGGGGGGGISNVGEGGGRTTLGITNSTLSGNSAGNGGAIFNVCQSSGKTEADIMNSTFSDNSQSAFYNPAGIYNLQEGSGGARIRLAGSIFNCDASYINISYDPDYITSLGYNLCSDFGGGCLTNVTDQINTNPLLGPLQDNGGPTFTHALLPGSPAIDAGRNLSASTSDQRGFARAYNDPALPDAAGGDGTDIGAFEVQKAIVLAIQSDGSGGFWVQLAAPTNVIYRLQRASSLTGTWTDLATNTAPESGLIQYHETHPPFGQAFYRTVQP